MKLQRPLEGRVAVVTGAARGLGEATARQLARRGARLALSQTACWSALRIMSASNQFRYAIPTATS
ncbi:SDR family NAD(P)-dependent oxidoreductase [Streptomyces fructofermentans]|uniref:SDR family NAD(P)-dependent oxidoreductase n=1 Tax=Streptomyces fructofermentans TaxID=152141 RepID=UPI003F4D18DA